jgi:hypothetical protein
MTGQASIDPALLKAANINPSSGLATDYLNHFNEVAMMIGLFADMPEMADAVLDWRPVDYATHFRQTGFSDRDLAIAAFEDAAPEVKARFREACCEVELAIQDVQDLLRAAPETAPALAEHGPLIFALIARVGGVINGVETTAASDEGLSQDDLDALFA